MAEINQKEKISIQISHPHFNCNFGHHRSKINFQINLKKVILQTQRSHGFIMEHVESFVKDFLPENAESLETNAQGTLTAEVFKYEDGKNLIFLN
jgi:hypothetical protein